MTVYIENAETAPQLEYNRLFMESLVINQASENNNSVPPKYELQITYRLYAVDEDGLRHFKQKVNILKIEDYRQAAIIKAQAGDMDLANAMAAIELALAKIVEDQTDLGQTTVTQ